MRRTFSKDMTPIQNPLIGWVMNAANSGITRPFSLVHANLTWREAEAVRGIYDFSEFEAKNRFEHWRGLGKHLILRLVLDYPGPAPHLDIPDWLHAVSAGTEYHNSYGYGFSPAYDDAVLLAHHQKLLQAMGARYNNDQFVAFIQLGSVGHWGEWHTSSAGAEGSAKIPYPAQSVCDKIIRQYAAAFPNKILMMRRPETLALKYKMGLFNDSFGDPDETDSMFLSWIAKGYQDSQNGSRQPPMPDFWKHGPSAGEVASSPVEKWFSAASFPHTLAQAQNIHTSFLGPASPVYCADPAVQANMDALADAMGYRFHISETTFQDCVAPGGVLNLTATINNLGIAPFYCDWPLNLYVSDSAGNVKLTQRSKLDLRTLLPGSAGEVKFSIRVPKSWAGQYAVSLGIVDPMTKQDVVRWANAGNGLTMLLGSISVGRAENRERK